MDLWHVDLNISEQKFKGEGLHTIKIALPKNYVFSFDLKAVYHYVDIFFESSQITSIFMEFWHRVCQTFSIHGSAFCAF